MCLVRQHIAEPSQRRDYEKKSAEPDEPNRVTSEAPTSVNPSAMRKGHGVGAGNWIVPSCCRRFAPQRFSHCVLRSSAHHVNNGEDDDPDSVHEMPVERQGPDALRMLRAHRAGERERKRDEHHDDTDHHMRSMQSHQ